MNALQAPWREILLSIALTLFCGTGVIIAQSHHSCAHGQFLNASGTGGSSSNSTNECGIFPEKEVDFGNEYYIPGEEDDILEIRVNIWVISYPTMYNGANGVDPYHFALDDNDFKVEFENQQTYFKTVLDKANELVYANAGLSEICLNDVVTDNDLSIDSKIRLVLNKKPDGSDAFYYRSHEEHATNFGGSAYYHFNIGGDQYDDAINVVFIQDDSVNYTGGATGAGNPDNVHFLVNWGYQNYLNDKANLEGQNFAHEFNHVLGLEHTDDSESQRLMFNLQCEYHKDDTDWNHSLNNNMSDGGKNQRYLHPLQVGFLRRYLWTSFASRFVKDMPSSPGVIEINNTEILDTELHWAGDIVVNNGGVLIIPVGVNLLLSEHSNIYVKRGGKLIVDGGVITSCEENVKWPGIKVEGNRSTTVSGTSFQLDHPGNATNGNMAGVVWLKNGAIISQAKDAISTNNKHLGWPEVKDHWGGLIWTEGDSKFEYCDRAVEIMKYGTPEDPDKSSFKETFFENLKDGVTVWDSDGVRFDHCTFKNIENAGIGPYNAAVIIDNGNKFQNSNIGIDVTGSKINDFKFKIGDLATERNSYSLNDIGIVARRVLNSSPMVIENNYFSADISAGSLKKEIHLVGDSKYNIRRNTFYKSGGIEVNSTGNISAGNQISENKFTSAKIGVRVVGNNTFLNIQKNCIQVLSPSIWITSDGILSPQGTIFTEAGNHLGAATDIYNENANAPLDYYYQEDRVPGDGVYPDLVSFYVFPKPAYFENEAEECGTNFNAPPPSGALPCTLGEGISGTKDLIQSIEQEMLEMSSESEGYISLKTCLNENLNHLYKAYLAENSSAAAVEYFSARPEFFQRTYALSALLDEEDYEQATLQLAAINPTSDAEYDYVEAQTLNLNYLKNMLTYELSPENYQFLKSMAEDVDDYSGYAAGIFTFITGERISYPESESTEMPDIFIQPEIEQVIAQEVKVYPNPILDGTFTVEIPELANGLIEIRDLQGRLMREGKVTSGTHQMNIDDFGNGVYLIKIDLGVGVPFVEKINVMK